LPFLALNWPANAATCSADQSKSILDGAGPLVWQTYSGDSDIFVGRGLMPVPWCNDWTTTRAAVVRRLPAKVRLVGHFRAEGNTAKSFFDNGCNFQCPPNTQTAAKPTPS